MKVSRLRTRAAKAKSLKSTVISYLAMMAVLAAFLLGLYLLAVLEFLLIRQG